MSEFFRTFSKYRFQHAAPLGAIHAGKLSISVIF